MVDDEGMLQLLEQLRLRGGLGEEPVDEIHRVDVVERDVGWCGGLREPFRQLRIFGLRFRDDFHAGQVHRLVIVRSYSDVPDRRLRLPSRSILVGARLEFHAIPNHSALGRQALYRILRQHVREVLPFGEILVIVHR